MAHTLFSPNSESNGLAIAAYRVVSFFEKIAQDLAKRKEQRATFKTLQSLSDRELNDIGISRGDIRAIAMDIWEDNNRRDARPHVSVNANLEGSV